MLVWFISTVNFMPIKVINKLLYNIKIYHSHTETRRRCTILDNKPPANPALERLTNFMVGFVVLNIASTSVYVITMINDAGTSGWLSLSFYILPTLLDI